MAVVGTTALRTTSLVEVSAVRFFKVTETERADLLYLVPFLLSIFCQLNCWEYEVGNATMIMIIVLISLTIRVICSFF